MVNRPPLPYPRRAVDEKQVAIFGSTGSIGTATLDVMASLAARDPTWRVTLLSTHSRVELLTEQVDRFRPRYAIVTAPAPFAVPMDLVRRMEAAGAKVIAGAEAAAGAAELAGAKDTGGTVVGAVVGAAGLAGVLAAVRAGKRVALANKESLVVAGGVVMPAAKASGAKILPVDSEHSAVFQAMAAGRRQDIRRVILTASGGPFRTVPAAQMESATVAEALNHPTWKMGGKITIDSATMFNKAFELIEARWLFDLTPEELEVVVHPQSVVHSMAEFVDGSVIAQLSPPDMRLPIQYALTYPDRTACPGPKMDWTKSHTLTFEPADRVKFRALDLATEVMRQGGTLGAVVNAANEVAVAAFLAGRGTFGDICRTVERVAGRHRVVADPDLGELLAADAWARDEAVRGAV